MKSPLTPLEFLKNKTKIQFKPTYLFLFLTLWLFTAPAFGQITTDPETQEIQQSVPMDFNAIRTILLTAPNENLTGNNPEGANFSLSVAGVDYELEAWSSPIMSTEFQALYPDIKTFSFQSKNQKGVSGRLTINNEYLSIYLMTPNGHYVVAPADLTAPGDYEIKKDQQNDTELSANICHYETEKKSRDIERERINEEEDAARGIANSAIQNGATLRIYDFALVCTAEFHDENGGTVAAAMMVAVTTMDAVQAIYDRDLAIRFNLLPIVVYDNVATDPFVPDDAGGCSRTDQAANAVALNFAIDDYDIGHVFHASTANDDWSGGGVAGLGVVCDDGIINGSCTQGGSGNHVPNIGSYKAWGWSGSFNNATDSWYGLVAHELGHMFNAPHTFNGEGGSCTANISSSTSYEIASGTTIMSYRGICQADNNVPAPLPANNYFHAHSLERMVNYINGAGNCVGTPSGNTPPEAEANTCGGAYTIPPSTPFILTGSGSDADGDDLLYSWEQYDEDGAGTPTQGFFGAVAGASPIAPLFRNYPQAARLFVTYRFLQMS